MLPSQACIDLVKKWEGCRLEAFKPIPSDPWTIGWGRTRGVRKGDTCTQEQADDWLMEDLLEARNAIERAVMVPLNQNQFDALCSFTYNVGPGKKGVRSGF